MNDIPRFCVNCAYWDPTSPTHGRCRRHAPTVPPRPDSDGTGSFTSWPSTLAEDWCGEWESRDPALVPREPLLDPEQDRALRNASIAEALLVLPPEKRDRLLLEVLTEEERQRPAPPDDFYERVQDYFAHQQDLEP